MPNFKSLWIVAVGLAAMGLALPEMSAKEPTGAKAKTGAKKTAAAKKVAADEDPPAADEDPPVGDKAPINPDDPLGEKEPIGQKEPGKKPAAKGAPDRAFAKVKKEFQLKIKTKKPTDRIAALRLLEDSPSGDAAELLYVTLLDDKASEVRQAAVALLAAWRDKNDVTDKLLTRMNTASRKSGMDVRAVGALQALAGTEDEGLQAALLKYLDEYLGQPQADQFLLHEMIDTQSAKGDPEESLRMLTLLTRAQFFNGHFGYRRCLVQGLMEVKDLEALTKLIDLLPKFQGLVQFDVVSHLTATTGQNYGDDAAKWSSWWSQNKGKLKSVDKPKNPPIGNVGNFGEYYGIPICAKRVVFVLDTSLSMRGARIDAAKTELIRAIKALSQEVFFDVIAFDNTVRVWQRELVPATEQMKQLAVNVVIEQPLKFKTASYDALEAAFELNPEVIFFLSDGAPFGGKIDAPAEIIATIGRWNRVRRVSIHSIGVGVKEPKAEVFAAFLRDLAETNWGVYKPVN